MTTVLDRWGNSLGVRLPKGIAEAAGLREGDRVSIQFERGAVVIRHARPSYTLESLLDGMTPNAIDREFESATPVGAERFWESE